MDVVNCDARAFEVLGLANRGARKNSLLVRFAELIPFFIFFATAIRDAEFDWLRADTLPTLVMRFTILSILLMLSYTLSQSALFSLPIRFASSAEMPSSPRKKLYLRVYGCNFNTVDLLFSLITELLLSPE